MTDDKLPYIKELVVECVKKDKLDFLANLILSFQNDYQELATLCTDGNYNEKWSHKKVLDYITYEAQ